MREVFESSSGCLCSVNEGEPFLSLEVVPLSVPVSSDFRRRVFSFPEGDFLKYCMQCSLCSSVCPVARVVEGFNPRRILWEVFLGLEDNVVDNGNVWLCLSCHLCMELCPMKVKVSHVIMLLKNIAAEKGKVPDGLLEEIKYIFKTGRSMPLSPAIDKRRTALSLPPLPGVDVEEVQTLLRKLKFPFNEEGEKK